MGCTGLKRQSRIRGPVYLHLFLPSSLPSHLSSSSSQSYSPSVFLPSLSSTSSSVPDPHTPFLSSRAPSSPALLWCWLWEGLHNPLTPVMWGSKWGLILEFLGYGGSSFHGVSEGCPDSFRMEVPVDTQWQEEEEMDHGCCWEGLQLRAQHSGTFQSLACSAPPAD